ncbi:fungal-specific transcription factor domain-containing protein [Infundibulicybe gibba]|nr:fungal-specific transcription factor domain-containing protein [Infundibulicybe gibba]
MSSNEDENETGTSTQSQEPDPKRRRLQRACDICRRKKSDGIQTNGGRCSHCKASGTECTYVEAAKKRVPAQHQFFFIKKDPSLQTTAAQNILPGERTDSSASPPPSPSSHKMVSTVIHGATCTAPDGLDDEEVQEYLVGQSLKRLSLDPIDHRFLGRSSGVMLIKTALELKKEFTGLEMNTLAPHLGKKRPEYWFTHPWERTAGRGPSLTFNFPDADLLQSLTELYFVHINLFFPLLHKPSFKRSVSEGLHYKDEMFSVIVLLVCAIGARFSSDRRVLLDGVDSFRSAGWGWFNQVQMLQRGYITLPTLYDLQYYCLSVHFLQRTSTPQACWSLVGMGLRMAQDIGAHRRVMVHQPPTVERELLKRAFWVLHSLDVTISALLGRPCGIHSEDYDVEMPTEMDDEHWDHPDPEARKQPDDEPSLLTSFTLLIKLNHILGILLRTVYAINKSKVVHGLVGKKWEQHIVSELDSALNKWVDSIPPHLRWDPNRTRIEFFNQSAMLYCSYYQIQILLHRPFIPSPNKPSPLSFPSLAICTNAARSCTHVIDAYHKRNQYVLSNTQILVSVTARYLQLLTVTQLSAMTSGIVLLLNMWGGRRSGRATDLSKEMVDVHTCMEVIKASEDRYATWPIAGRLWSVFYSQASHSHSSLTDYDIGTCLPNLLTFPLQTKPTSPLPGTWSGWTPTPGTQKTVPFPVPPVTLAVPPIHIQHSCIQPQSTIRAISCHRLARRTQSYVFGPNISFDSSPASSPVIPAVNQQPRPQYSNRQPFLSRGCRRRTPFRCIAPN